MPATGQRARGSARVEHGQRRVLGASWYQGVQLEGGFASFSPTNQSQTAEHPLVVEIVLGFGWKGPIGTGNSMAQIVTS